MSCPTSGKSVSCRSLQLKGRGWTVIRLYWTHKETFICSHHKQSHTTRLDNSTISLPEEAILYIYLSLSHTHTHTHTQMACFDLFVLTEGTYYNGPCPSWWHFQELVFFSAAQQLPHIHSRCFRSQLVSFIPLSGWLTDLLRTESFSDYVFIICSDTESHISIDNEGFISVKPPVMWAWLTSNFMPRKLILGNEKIRKSHSYITWQADHLHLLFDKTKHGRDFLTSFWSFWCTKIQCC